MCARLLAAPPFRLQGGAGSNATVTLVPSGDLEACDAAVADMKRRCSGGRLVVVDYTHPSSVNANADFYAIHGLDFVMGTTGGDRYALKCVCCPVALFVANVAGS